MYLFFKNVFDLLYTHYLVNIKRTSDPVSKIFVLKDFHRHNYQAAYIGC